VSPTNILPIFTDEESSAFSMTYGVLRTNMAPQKPERVTGDTELPLFSSSLDVDCLSEAYQMDTKCNLEK
jgi:hypothetical protein